MLTDRLLKAAQVAEILQVGVRTAYTIMHDMEHVERPFRVRESALERWILEHSAGPGRTLADELKPTRGRNRQKTILPQDWHIPRRREAI